MLFCVLLCRYPHHRDLHSFPTRRSSDLDALEAIPGVSSAAFLTAMPLEGRDADWDVIDVQGAASFLSADEAPIRRFQDRKSTRLNSSHSQISYAVFCLKKKGQYHC